MDLVKLFAVSIYCAAAVAFMIGPWVYGWLALVGIGG